MSCRSAEVEPLLVATLTLMSVLHGRGAPSPADAGRLTDRIAANLDRLAASGAFSPTVRALLAHLGAQWSGPDGAAEPPAALREAAVPSTAWLH